MTYAVRRARRAELPLLAEVERRAAARFAGLGLLDERALAETVPLPALVRNWRAGRVWVAVTAEGEPVGFAVAAPLGRHAHLFELDVVPAHGSRGLGRRLVEVVARWAGRAGYRALTLSTFRTPPWNAPWYARLGFRALAEHELEPALRALREDEAAHGLPVAARVVMQRDLAGG